MAWDFIQSRGCSLDKGEGLRGQNQLGVVAPKGTRIHVRGNRTGCVHGDFR